MNWIFLAAGAAAKSGTGPVKGFDTSMLFMILMLGVMYVVLFLPQRKQQKQRQAMLDALKKGDKVITVGGIHGEIVDINEDDVRLRIADKVEIKCTRSSVSKVKG